MQNPTPGQLHLLDNLATSCGFRNGSDAAKALYGLAVNADTISVLITGLRARRDTPLLRSGPALVTMTDREGEFVDEEFTHVELFGTASGGPCMLECHDGEGRDAVVRSLPWSSVVEIEWTAPLALAA